MKKIILIPAIFFGLVIAVASYGYAKYWNVAIVNGQPISRIQFYNALQKQGGKQVLDQLVEDTLIVSEGKSKNVTVDQKSIDEEIASIETRLKAQGQELTSALATNNMTRADLEFQIRLKKIQDTLAVSTVEITQADVDKFLTDNKEMIPAGKTKEELNALAKEQLVLEANQASASAWLNNLKTSAKIIYK